MSRRLLDSVLGANTVPTALSRRELLKSGLATAASLLVSASENRADQQRGRDLRVIVVGAGFAGLACGFELASTGCDVKVLEARDRVGGRVHSISDLVPGKYAEAGGEFLGGNHPTVISYAAKFGLDLVDIPEFSSKLPPAKILNGRRLAPEECRSTRIEINAALDQLTKMAIPVVPDRPWDTPDASTLDRQSTGDWISTLDISSLAKDLIRAQLTSTNGVPVALQSQLGNLSQIRGGDLERYWTHSELYRCRGGNDQFAKKLAEGITAERIHLKTAVNEIETRDNQVIVRTVSGDAHVADYVVLCIPPSVWPTIRFSPNLPEVLRPQMGNSVKFLTSVRDHFWERHEMEPTSIAYSGTGHTSLSTGNQNLRDQREVLISFISGPLAESWSKRREETRVLDYQTDIETLQPGFRKSIEKTIFVDWLSTPWTAAGYSFPAPGQITSLGPIMREGIGRLQFAGEHTCYQFVGYMEGGLRSGVDAAKRILNFVRG